MYRRMDREHMAEAKLVSESFWSRSWVGGEDRVALGSLPGKDSVLSFATSVCFECWKVCMCTLFNI